MVLSLLMWGTMGGMGLYWRKGKAVVPPNESHHAALISAPILTMTLVMGTGSVGGVLAIAYFTAVFVDCDLAVNAESRLAIAADFTLQAPRRPV